MLFANRCTWAHAVAAAAGLLRAEKNNLLDLTEMAAVEGRGDPRDLADHPQIERKVA